MNWYTWNSQEEFNIWHEIVIHALNLPRVGVNALTGKPEPEKQQTTSYTSVMMVSETDWRAPVEDSVASSYPEGLGLLSEAPPIPEDEIL